ncbi:hypothetical protein [Nocardioides speluncae]|uniref:hypothetical protein n=1 Tax=Nocardioides speluncae TaxID=2670337 RepID=UPI000D69D154|nr:hypothetical protein [Nocardioides speluncae]
MSSTGESEPTRSRPPHPNPPPAGPPAGPPQGSEPTRVQPAGPPPGQQQPGQPPAPYQPPAGLAYGPPAGGQPPRRTGGKGWLWALGGFLVASLVWGAVLGALLLTGVLGGSVSLGDYEYTDDLCKAVDLKPLEESGFTVSEASGTSENPTSRGTEHDAIDSMSCFTSLTGEGSVSGYHYTWADLHKETDPEPEFESRYLAYNGYDETDGVDYTVEELSDLGDQAFLVTQTSDGEYAGGEVVLGILDGGLTYQATWNAYSSTDAADLDGDEIADQLREVAEGTLDDLED